MWATTFVLEKILYIPKEHYVMDNAENHLRRWAICDEIEFVLGEKVFTPAGLSEYIQKMTGVKIPSAEIWRQARGIETDIRILSMKR